IDNITEIDFLEDGRCNLVLLLHCEKRKYVLKIAKGEYRSQELYSEHLILRELMDKRCSLSVPTTYQFCKNGSISFHLQEFISGKPLNFVLEEVTDEKVRLRIFNEMGKQLSQIHNLNVYKLCWGEWINGQLAIAEKNLQAGVLDLAEFFETEQPKKVLDWLKSNKPIPGKVCLLHGDYRPKNLLGSGYSIDGVIDWAFCDLGDPYYDLAIVQYYLKTNEQKLAFFDGYGLGEKYDVERTSYFDLLSKFINI
ncbi:MAG: aminoglycoside phosphotransferase family protein, partial [Desulfobacterales bacterium]|nr:aminoglycoside phosphotransferase family protein [Desulfobacterales bacterium]